MKDQFYLGLYRPVEIEKQHAIQYLGRNTEKYKDLLFQLIDCAYDIQNNKTISRAHIDLLKLGMEQSIELVFYDYSGKYVSILSHNFAEAQQLLQNLAQDKKSQIRFNAVTILLSKPHPAVINDVIQKCVSDKSSKVRKKIADVCQRLHLVDMLPTLERQREIEIDESVKASLDFSIGLVRDEYILEDKGTDKLDLLVETNDGLIGLRIPKDKLEIYKIQDVLKSVRENGKLPWE